MMKSIDLFMDGSATLEICGIGIVLKGPNKQVYEQSSLI